MMVKRHKAWSFSSMISLAVGTTQCEDLDEGQRSKSSSGLRFSKNAKNGRSSGQRREALPKLQPKKKPQIKRAP